MAKPRLLLISNGHGEDVVGAHLARALSDVVPGAEIMAMPTVGLGRAYRDAPVRRVPPQRELPGGGTTLRDVAALTRDLRAGVAGLTWSQARALRGLRVDVVVAVGDVLAQGLALLPRAKARYAVQTLVSARMRDRPARGIGTFRHRFTAVERLLLRSRFRHVYPRDPESEAWLREHRVPAATYLGNPMMDGLEAEPLRLQASGPRIVALPGSRPGAGHCLALLASAAALLPAAEVVVPWARSDEPSLDGWTPCPSPVTGLAWRRGGARLHLVRDRFASTLCWGDLALGATGTAQEQAAGLGLPVIAVPCGAAAAPGFLENQRLLLGDALEAVPASAQRIAEAALRLADDPAEQARRGAIGRERMGAPGGAGRIARHLVRDAFRADVAGAAVRVP